MDPRFPHDDVEELGRRLTASVALAPGWILPEVGLLSIRGLLVSEHIDGFKHVILPDRNIASCMARVARTGARLRDDQAASLAFTKLIASIEMRFCDWLMNGSYLKFAT